MHMPVNSVLYAEDDENDVFFMQRAFRKLDLKPVLRVVPNGKVATEYLSGAGPFGDRSTHPLPQLLLLDLKMPIMSGLEVLEWARAHGEFASLPIVLFTSSTQKSDVDFCRLHGADAYFAKPSNSSHLEGLMRSILAALESPDGALALGRHNDNLLASAGIV